MLLRSCQPCTLHTALGLRGEEEIWILGRQVSFFTRKHGLVIPSLALLLSCTGMNYAHK
ncbi:unnamed protein product [Musa acuminata var. zebrina]